MLEPSKLARWILCPTGYLLAVQYILPPFTSKVGLDILFSIMKRVSMLEPSKLARWILLLPVITSVQYICDKVSSPTEVSLTEDTKSGAAWPIPAATRDRTD